MTRLGPMVALAAVLAIASRLMAGAAQQPTRWSDEQVENLLSRIDKRTDTFRSSFNRAIDRNPVNDSRAEDQINRSVQDFEQATDRLRDRVNDRESATSNVEEVLSHASLIDSFMVRNQLDASAEDDWKDLRQDLDQLAHVYGVTSNWRFAGSMPERADDKAVEQLLQRIDRGADRFRTSLDKALGSAKEHATAEDLNHLVTEFADTTERLSGHLNRNQVVANDVEQILQRGASIDGLVRRRGLSEQVEKDWLSLRRDLDGLARAYDIVWNWSDPGDSQDTGTDLDHHLTGTYQLQSNRGDNPRNPASRGFRNHLDAPDVIAIDRSENRITMASTLGPQVSFEADGSARTEWGSDGNTISTRATLYRDQLVVTTTGNRESNFRVTFEPMDNGRDLRLTRQIYDAEPSQRVTAESFYRKSTKEADWDLHTGMQGSSHTNPAPGDELVPRGTQLVATLNDALNAEHSRVGDRFTLTIRSPSQYEDAVILGFVTGANVAGRVSGRSELSLAFQTIRLNDGSVHEFHGWIENVLTPDGETIRVSDEGTIEQESQTAEIAQRGAIGAAIGAVIGAIPGAEKGAARGAIIGAGAGAGTLSFQGRDRLDLPRGTEVTIVSGALGSWRMTTNLPR